MCTTLKYSCHIKAIPIMIVSDIKAIHDVIIGSKSLKIGMQLVCESFSGVA